MQSTDETSPHPEPTAFILPASFAQQRLWFLDQLEPDQSSYLVPIAWRLNGLFRLDAARLALNRIVERHETMRTSFVTEAGEPVQVVQPYRPFELTLEDFSTLADPEAAAREAAVAEANRTFRLGEGPLFRAKVLRIGADEHLLLFTTHHIVFDGWSKGVWTREFAAFYREAVTGELPGFPDLEIQYGDYASWQREQLQGERLEQHVGFWKEALKGAAGQLGIPTDRPRPAVQSRRGATASFRVAPAVSESLRKICRETQTTMFMATLAAFELLLSRYSGQDDVVVGTPITNREQLELEPLIGFFSNTLPMRLTLESGDSFLGVLQKVRRYTLDAYAHRELPFEKLVEHLQPERSMSFHPVFQTMFALHKPEREPPSLPDLTLSLGGGGRHETKFDLYLSMVDAEDGLRGAIEYSTDLFEPETVQRMLDSYQVLLARAVAAPAAPVAGLEILTPTERELLLFGWNDTFADYPRDRCLHDLLSAHALEHAERTALRFGDVRVSYRELERKTNQLAHHLRASGTGRGDRVGVYLERSIDLLVALIAVIKTGAAYVPLDPRYPPGRIAMIVEDAEVSCLLTSSALRSALPEYAGVAIAVDTEAEVIAGRPDQPIASGAVPSDLLYVIFTSGSTGRPKGVEISHGAAVNLLTSMARTLSLGPDDVFLALTSAGFDISVAEFFLPLLTGGTVAIAESHHATNGEELAALLQRYGVTAVQATPTTWNLLLDAGYSGAGVKRSVGGEGLPVYLFERLMQAAPGTPLWNWYGPTETTIWSTVAMFLQPEDRLTVGRPIANTQVYVLDRNRQLCPVGVPGEIHIAGDGVARGYRGRAELTASVFLPDPFSSVPGARMYKTADLGRWLADGTIEHLGRIDHQVKLRGHRIELGEIEAALAKAPGIREAVCAVREDSPGDKRLVAYLLADREPDPAELRRTLKETLPDYMLPSTYVRLERLPLTPNGKIDRLHLPAPTNAPERSRADVPGTDIPGTAVQQIVAAIWADLLKLENIQLEDDFFELGGHSLLATRMVSLVREALHVELPLRLFFEQSTLQGLSETVETLRGNDGGVHLPALTRVDRGQPQPLSFAQQRFWLLNEMNSRDTGYTVKSAIRLRGELDAQAMARCVAEIYACNEVLRTTYRGVHGLPEQLIHPSLDGAELEVLDVGSAGEAEALRLITEAALQPFRLATGPVCRFLLCRIARDHHVLAMLAHHICMDGASAAMVFEDLAALYGRTIAGKQFELAQQRFDYVDFAAWQRGWMQGETLERHLEFWRTQLQGLPSHLELPADHPSEAPGTAGELRSISIGDGLSTQIADFCKAHRSTPFTLLLTSLAALLHRWTAGEHFVIGTVAGNRPLTELERVCGCFLNMLPLRMDVTGQEKLSELFERARTVVQDGFSYGQCPFETIVEALRVERKTGRNPIFNVALLLQNFAEGGFRTESLQAEGVAFPRDTALLDLRFVVSMRGENVRIACEYKRDLFGAETIDALLEAYSETIRATMREPSASIGALPLPARLAQTAKPAKTSVVIAATFTAEPVEEPLRFWFGQLEMNVELNFAPYHQIFQSLLDPASSLRRNNSGYNVLMVRLEDWAQVSLPLSPAVIESLERSAEELISAVQLASSSSGSRYILLCCPASSALAQDPQWAAFEERVQSRIAKQLGEAGMAQVITPAELRELYPVARYEDRIADAAGHVPYTTEFFAAVATMLVRRIYGLSHPPYKVIAVDCDNTLWSGVCAEDGPLGVVIDEHHQEFQRFLQQQRRQGMLLCLCSKNSEQDVWDVFAQNPRMILRRDEIVLSRINWERKPDNLRSLASELGLGLDSFIFLDDNPVECAEVEQQCPEVLTLQIPDRSDQIQPLLRHVWAFDHFALTETDSQRSQLYQDNQQREQLRQGQSLDEFIESLQLKLTIEPLTDEDVARVAQLTQRTNQFNSTTVRRQESEVRGLLNSSTQRCLTIRLRDRFGDYGLVGAVVYGEERDTLAVDSFFMSCRVLGRRVEHSILNRLHAEAQQLGLLAVEFRFVPTAKNTPMHDFLESLDATVTGSTVGESRYRVNAPALSRTDA